MATEDQEDADRAPLPDVRGEIAFDDVTFEYNPGVPVLKHVSFTRAGRLDDRAGRIERIGQEHADQPGDDVQPAAVRAACSSTATT